MPNNPLAARLLALAALLFSGPPVASGQDVIGDVFYQFMPIAWRDSNNDASRFGDFAGMTASLDYLESLGVTAIWMNPIHPSPAYHGYQHGDGSQVNAWFGTQANFIAFLGAAHARGIKVFIDFVAYGISHNSIWFQSAFNNPASPYDSWLAFTNGANTTYWGSLYTTWNGSSVGQIHWDLRDHNPVSLVTQWAEHWLDPNGDGIFTDGVDGFRLDHVWESYPYGPGGWGYHIDTFWAPWRAALRAVNPDVFVFAEQADWGLHGQELFVGMDAAFTKPFEFAARDALANETSLPLENEIQATISALASAPAPGTFICTIGNHDVSRLATAIGDGFDKGKAAAAVLMTQPFPPCVYYGDEIGMRGAKNPALGGDASDIPMREPFKWNAVAGPPMSNYFVLNGPAYTNRISRNNDGRSVEEQDGVSGSLLETYKALIAARKGSAALTSGAFRAVPNARQAVWTFLRSHSSQQVLVAINLSGAVQNDVLDLSRYDVPGGSTIPMDLINSQSLPAITTANRGSYALTLPSYGFRILVVSLVPLPPPAGAVDGLAIPADFGPWRLFATQNNATALGNNVSELNQLYLRTSEDTLFAGLTGNLATDGTGLSFFLDTEPGGQNTLDMSGAAPPPNGPDQFTGLRFDAGFEPDHLIYVNTFGGAIYVDQFELLSGGGVVKTYRGQGSVGDGDGALTGGTNPNGMRVAMDNSNMGGVSDVDASGAASAMTGFELAVPYADAGIPYPGSVAIRVAAFINLGSGAVSNQWLPGLGEGQPNLGLAPDLRSITGDQHVTVTLPLDSSAAGDPPPASFAFSYAYPQGGRSRLRFTYSIPASSRVTLRIHDVRGRLVRTLVEESQRAGGHTVDWEGETEAGQPAASGLYLATLASSAGWKGALKAVLVR